MQQTFVLFDPRAGSKRAIDQHTLLLRVGDATSLKVSGPGWQTPPL